MNPVYRKANIELPFSAQIHQSCFVLKIKASKADPSSSENGDEAAAEKACASLELSIEPAVDEGEECYELIVDYKLRVDEHIEQVERDCWHGKEMLLTVKLDSTSIGLLELSLNVRDTLAPQDLHQQTSFRNFHVLNADTSWYVNTNQLNALGGRMFKEWFERDCQGEQNAVVQSLNTNELGILLRACCAYSTPIVHRRNFDALIEIADKERMTGLLRVLESHLIESRQTHPIRKLEFAAEYRMSRLATSVLKSFPKIGRAHV